MVSVPSGLDYVAFIVAEVVQRSERVTSPPIASEERLTPAAGASMTLSPPSFPLRFRLAHIPAI
jgi:hypothetical protein